MDTKNKRIRRRKSVRSRIVGIGSRPRLTIFRSNKYIYAQIIDDDKGMTLLSVSDKSLKITKNTKSQKAIKVGEEIAKIAKTKKIKNVVFDRGQYKYHGRIKAVAEAARSGGLKF